MDLVDEFLSSVPVILNLNPSDLAFVHPGARNLFEIKHHQLLPETNHVGFVPKLNQSNRALG